MYKKLLGKGFVGSQSVLSYISARYDYAGDYRSLGYDDQYRDYTKLVLMDAEKINPILGRYEMTPIINIDISDSPVSFAFDVAADKSLLATGELACGITLNFHKDPSLNYEHFSRHSLRRDFLTSASQTKADVSKLIAQSRHEQLDTLMDYVTDQDRFESHSATQLLRGIDALIEQD